ncbi:Hypothetical predicted protein [Cloeon dipterum]|uniref:Uncharacterized protein n=1 Tax=Cloeon dipterum TaxID=197152 RepID=A0A8S1E5I1_9INSE|nr:Hypothetical predicted protein [Cloeon dipterum]
MDALFALAEMRGGYWRSGPPTHPASHPRARRRQGQFDYAATSFRRAACARAQQIIQALCARLSFSLALQQHSIQFICFQLISTCFGLASC